MNVEDEKKTCTECLLDKDLSEFYSRVAHSLAKGEYIYHTPKCKDCTINASMKWQKDNPRRHKENVRRRDSVEWRKERRRAISKEYLESGKYLEWQRNNKDRIKNYNQKRSNKKHTILKKEWIACKEYFNYECAYCGMIEQEHKKKYRQQLHKEHVIHEGRNDIKNCVPSCKSCNVSKHTATLNQWYNDTNPDYTRERYLKIYRWLRWDCKNMQ